MIAAIALTAWIGLALLGRVVDARSEDEARAIANLEGGSAMRATLRAHNASNRLIFERIQEDALQGHGVVISMTDCYRESDYGEPIVALKSYILSPFSEDAHVSAVLESIWEARRAVAADPLR